MALVLVGLGACRRPREGGFDAASTLPASTFLADAALEAGAFVDARRVERDLAFARLDAGTYDGALVGAANMVVSVLSQPVWPESDAGSERLGYLRHGARAAVLDGVMPNEECTDGWYELVSGGFVCGKAVTTDLKSPRVKLAPKGPDLDAGLPYRYGFNLTNGTPVYRRVLSIEDRKKYEPWLAPKPPEPSAEEGEVTATTAATTTPSSEDEASEAKPKAEARAAAAPSPSASASPWFLRADAGKADLRLGELKGRGVLVRRMVRGFFLALDRDFKAAGARWWRTTYGFAVPFERVALQPKLSDFHGVWSLLPDASSLAGAGAPPSLDAGALDASGDALLGDAMLEGAVQDAASEASALAKAGTIGEPGAAFVTSGVAVKIVYDRAKQKLGWAEALPKRRAVLLTGERVTLSGVTVLGTTEGFFVREADVRLAKKAAPPADLGATEKWIDVDLTRQALVAFEGARPVFATLISSGKRNAVDKEKDHPTPTGTFRIREKHVTTTMDGDVAADGPYSIEDVPWVMYFQGSFALHGAFWHNNFGGVRSHGCVNLAPDDARALFFWSDPPLPEGWHGVFSGDARPGTRIVIHEDEVPKTRRHAPAPPP